MCNSYDYNLFWINTQVIIVVVTSILLFILDHCDHYQYTLIIFSRW